MPSHPSVLGDRGAHEKPHVETPQKLQLLGIGDLRFELLQLLKILGFPQFKKNSESHGKRTLSASEIIFKKLTSCIVDLHKTIRTPDLTEAVHNHKVCEWAIKVGSRK